MDYVAHKAIVVETDSVLYVKYVMSHKDIIKKIVNNNNNCIMLVYRIVRYITVSVESFLIFWGRYNIHIHTSTLTPHLMSSMLSVFWESPPLL